MSYIAFPIGHRLLIRLFVGRKPPVIAHISIDMSSPLAQLAKKSNIRLTRPFFSLAYKKSTKSQRTTLSMGDLLGFTLQNSPNMAIFMAKMMTNNRWIF